MSEAVRQMFESIAPRYDLANQVLSLGIHGLWRRALVRRAALAQGSAVLDCATGTGDLALTWAAALGPSGRVVGLDFCAPMLAEARLKAAGQSLPISFQVGDAQALPFPDGSFDAASIAFGIRNVDDPGAALKDMARVVKPGGAVWVLEFGQPAGAFGAVYRWYARDVMPRVGAWVTGQRAPYEYLPRTAAAFPAGGRFLELMESTGAYSATEAFPLSLGIAFLYRGTVRARG